MICYNNANTTNCMKGVIDRCHIQRRWSIGKVKNFRATYDDIRKTNIFLS